MATIEIAPSTQPPIAYFPNQTAIAPSPPQNRSPIPSNQTAIAPHHPKPDRLISQIKQRSPLITHKPDRLFPSNQTAIAPHHPQTRSPTPPIKQRSPLITHKT